MVNLHTAELYQAPIPETRLQVAVLSRAIADFVSTSQIENHNRQGAWRWIFCESKDLCFNFEQCCEAAGANPKSLRKTLMKMHQERFTQCEYMEAQEDVKCIDDIPNPGQYTKY